LNAGGFENKIPIFSPIDLNQLPLKTPTSTSQPRTRPSPARNDNMADSQEPTAASKPDMAKGDGNTNASGGRDNGRDHKNPRHSGHKRSRMGKNKGRAEWE
jgi:hypothetical protein